MQEYYGTKRVFLTPMTRGEYNKFRGWELPSDESYDDPGYMMVEYTYGGKPNVVGYISWTPKEQADNAYQPSTAMSFGHALEALKAGKYVARSGWNGKGMYLALATESGYSFTINPYIEPHLVHGAFIGMKTVDNKFVPWLASQTDILANDWQIVESEQPSLGESASAASAAGSDESAPSQSIPSTGPDTATSDSSATTSSETTGIGSTSSPTESPCYSLETAATDTDSLFP